MNLFRRPRASEFAAGPPAALLRAVLANGCLLPGGQALTLRPARRALLRIDEGQVWITFDGPHAGPANDLGDRVLRAGDCLPVPAGERAVIEALPQRAGAAAARFRICPQGSSRA